MLKFHPYFILTGETRVGFLTHCVLKGNSSFFSTLELTHTNKDQKSCSGISGNTFKSKKLALISRFDNRFSDNHWANNAGKRQSQTGRK